MTATHRAPPPTTITITTTTNPAITTIPATWTTTTYKMVTCCPHPATTWTCTATEELLRPRQLQRWPPSTLLDPALWISCRWPCPRATPPSHTSRTTVPWTRCLPLTCTRGFRRCAAVSTIPGGTLGVHRLCCRTARPHLHRPWVGTLPAPPCRHRRRDPRHWECTASRRRIWKCPTHRFSPRTCPSPRGWSSRPPCLRWTWSFDQLLWGSMPAPRLRKVRYSRVCTWGAMVGINESIN